MKYVIIGGGLTGLYLGYLLKKINIDFEIYEKSSYPGGKVKTSCGSNTISALHINMLKLINKLDIKYNIKNNIITYNKKINDYLKIILEEFNNQKPKNISVYIFVNSVLTENDFQDFINLIEDKNILENEISTFMKYNFYDLNPTNKYNQLIELENPEEIIEKLTDYIKDNIYLGHYVQEINYLELTNKYLIMVNDRYINADKLIIATNISIKNIRLSLPKTITRQFNYIKSFPYIKLITTHSSKITDIKTNEILLLKSLFSNIRKIDNITLSMNYIIGDNANILFELLKTNNNDLLTKLLQNIIKNIPPVKKFKYCYWLNGYHINTKILKTNFYKNYNLLLAGEWVSEYHNTLEGSCISALKTYKIIESQLYIDLLKR